MEHWVLPIARNGDMLTIAVSDPFNVLLLDDLNILSGCRVRPVFAHPNAIRQAIDTVFDGGRREVEELLDEVTTGDIEVKEGDEPEDLSLGGDGDEVPAVKLVNLMLMKALKEKASDIHIEPGETVIRVRFRVDGRMHEVLSPPKGLLPALISRLKVLANLDIAERQVPQDGKFQIRYEGRQIDFRLSTLPVVGGEKAVMRILDQSGIAMSRLAMIFRRDISEDRSDLGGRIASTNRPSTRKRIRIDFSIGSMWMSLAFSRNARRSTRFTSLTAGTSSPSAPDEAMSSSS